MTFYLFTKYNINIQTICNTQRLAYNFSSMAIKKITGVYILNNRTKEIIQATSIVLVAYKIFILTSMASITGPVGPWPRGP